MLRKEVTYTDLNGEEATDVLYFHLSKADLIQLRVEAGPDLAETMKKISETEEGQEIWKLFKKILKLSYGKKSEDGRRFIKTDELYAEFESSEAYSELIMDLFTNPESAAEFMNGIIPQDLDEDLAKIAARNGTPEAAPAVTPDPQRLSREEVLAMDHDELKSGLATGRYVIAE